MSVSTRLRTDISTMYDYTEKPNPLDMRHFPNNIEIQLDVLPIIHPYVPRLCEQRGHFLIWWGTAETDYDLLEECLRSKDEAQWITCEDQRKIEKGVALIYPYAEEVIIGAVKTPAYFHRVRTTIAQRAFLRKMWSDIICMFGNRKLICPSGGYFNYLHLSMNQTRIPHAAYHRELMKQFKFKRFDNYWIREHE